ncbi:putative proteasome activator subunit [Neospora caninum Liverpool]|uniref:Proteasome activator subunit, putative n=1 Tax=Neospora caninum (strain Liverpool) TaxID=572307 RepID=F0VMB8_NEOCL|nr:putative proteasome activator subunit [Neospora caninum Liverpool]CBZ54396.1 putative proteasome activator subunit [Neospora caninum Liverpool]CEL69103.1 TPA: proteasome activator subunit, putative [Neospora caninum Liverpool]|eukprot:XP_003884426.1 putative proteasome activator subunit [Neospora caninum Liverpool]
MESGEPASGGMRRLEASEAPVPSASGTGPAPNSCSSFSSSFSSSSLAASSGATAGNKKRPRGGTGAGKTTGGGGDIGIAEAVRLMQSGKLAKLEPSEEKVKEDYEQYRNDVTRRALKILTDDLPRRIAQFLRLVDVNAEPGTLLVCDDLPPPPSLGPLLSAAELESFSPKPVESDEARNTASTSSRSAQPSFPWSFAVDPVVSLTAADSARLQKMLQEKVKAAFCGDRASAAQETASRLPKSASQAEEREGDEPPAGRDQAEGTQQPDAPSVADRGSRQEAICARLGQQAKFVKEEAVAMRELLNAVKIFMQLHVPRIEDGNNFGVAIQEEAIHLLNRVEESAFNLYDTVMKYYLARAKLCSKLVKYPNTLDYQMAVVELDRKEWVHLKITNLDLRNNYIMLYDLICKNWQNVIAPKGRNHSTSQQALY